MFCLRKITAAPKAVINHVNNVPIKANITGDVFSIPANILSSPLKERIILL